MELSIAAANQRRFSYSAFRIMVTPEWLPVFHLFPSGFDVEPSMTSRRNKKKIKFRPSILRFRIPHSAFRMMLVRWKRNNESVSIRIDLMELFNWQNQRWKWKSSAFRIPDRRDRKRFEISNELHHFDLIPTD